MEVSSESQQGGASPCSIGGLEGIAELLRCYICMEGLKDTTLCPHCCKLVCFNCVTKWINENRADCPHCRMALTVRELVKMPLFDTLVTVVEDLRSKQDDVSRLPSNEAQICPTHSRALSVYCETCRTAICYECALFSGQHKEHSFQPLDKLHKKHKLAVENELHKLRDRMRDILSFVLQVEKRVDGVRMSKSKTKREIQQLVEKMYTKVDGRTKDKLTRLEECRHFLRSQALKVMKAAHDLEKKIASGSYWSLMNQEGGLKKEVRESLDKLYNHPLKMEALSEPRELTNELVPNYTTGLFKIQPFKELQRKGEEVYSENLRMDGLTWRLKVYPNGHHEDVGRYLAVFMELSEGYEKVTSYQYCIEMLYSCTDKHPQRNYSRDYVSDFGDGECWGYKKYYQLSKLSSEGFLKGDALLLRFSVRHVTYHDKCADLAIYTNTVRQERNTLKEQLKESQSQLSSLKAENKKLASSVRPRSSPSTTRRADTKPATRRISPRSSSRHHLAAPSFHHHSHSHESTRYQLSTSQQALHQSSPKRSSYLPSDDTPPRHMLVSRRRSHDIGLNQRSIIEHRRRSADPAVTYDPDSDPDHYHYPAARAYYSQAERPLFEDSNSDHGGSQSLVTEDMTDEIASNASTITVKLSQADFNEYDHPDITIDAPPPMEYLSQPSSPPKSRVGKSLTDIPTLSHSQQYLSQSGQEFPHYPSQWEGGYYTVHDRPDARWFHDGRFRRPVAKPNIPTSQGQIRRMRSDPHLSSEPLAVKSSALKQVAEEEEEGRESQRKVKGQQLGKKHLQATVVTSGPKAESVRPAESKSGLGSCVTTGKSSSTSSLNLSQIL